MPIVESEPGTPIRSDLRGAPAVNDRAYASSIFLSISIPPVITLCSCEKKSPFRDFIKLALYFHNFNIIDSFTCFPQKVLVSDTFKKEFQKNLDASCNVKDTKCKEMFQILKIIKIKLYEN